MNATNHDDLDLGHDLEITKTHAAGFRRRDLGLRDAERAPLRRPGLPRARREPGVGNRRQPHLEALDSAAGRQARGLQLGPRGGHRRPPTDTTRAIVDFLAGGLADYIYAE